MGSAASQQKPRRSAQLPKHVSTCPNFDKKRFSKVRWFQIAHNIPELNTCGNVVTQITSGEESEFTLLNNSTYYRNKLKSSKTGIISTPDPSDSSKMSVQFLSDEDMQLPPEKLIEKLQTIKMSYMWVFDTDYENYALLGTPLGHLWIITTKPYITESSLKELVNIATSKGFNVSKLVLSSDVVVPEQ